MVAILQCEVDAHILCSEKFRKIHSNTAIPETLLNKVARPLFCKFIKKRLQHGCFTTNFAKFLKIIIK